MEEALARYRRLWDENQALKSAIERLRQLPGALQEQQAAAFTPRTVPPSLDLSALPEDEESEESEEEILSPPSPEPERPIRHRSEHPAPARSLSRLRELTQSQEASSSSKNLKNSKNSPRERWARSRASKSVSAILNIAEERKQEEAASSKGVRRRSRSPTSRASLLLRKSRTKSVNIQKEPPADSPDRSPSGGKEGAQQKEQREEKKDYSHCVAVIFRPHCQREKQQFVRFVESFSLLLPASYGMEWYRGLCSIQRNGQGCFYVQGQAPLCGTWENNELARAHHDFLPAEIQAHHERSYHAPHPADPMISPPLSRRRPPLMEMVTPLVSEDERCLFDSMLPEELRVYVFSFLGIPSLLQASLVSTEWKRLTNDPTLWCAQHIRRWGGYRTPDNELIQEVGAVDWQDAVRTHYLLDRNWRLGDCYASTLRGHSGWVTCVDMHHNRLVSSSYDGTVRVWNTQTGNSLQTFPAMHQEGLSPVWCVQFRGHTIMSGSSDSSVRQWNMNTGQCVQVFEGHEGGVKCLQYNDEASTLLSGSDDKTVKLFDVRSGECVQSLQYGDSVGNLTYHDHMLLTVIKRESKVYWYDLRTASMVRTLEGHSKAVYCLHYDPSSHSLVTGSRDRNILRWNLHTGEPEQTFSGHQFTVMSVQADATKIVSGSGDQTIKIWDIKTGRCSNTLPGHTEVVMSVKFDETKIVSGSADKTAVVWDFQRRARGY